MEEPPTIPEVSVDELVTGIHVKSGQIVIAVTGAGTQSLAWLFAQGGTSRTVLEALVPYSSAAQEAFTGRSAEQHVSASEAMFMAEKALERAETLTVNADDSAATLLGGVACTAAIATDRVRRGENRCHVALATNDGRRSVMSLVMSKGARDRAGEEKIASLIVLNAIAEVKMVEARVNVPLLDVETLQTQVMEPDSE